MTPERGCGGEGRYALLSNGANFGCEVLRGLQSLKRPPALLVLPEYAPAAASGSITAELPTSRPRRKLLQLCASIPIAYAPVARQAQCARLLRQEALDFLLVACWPYRIEKDIIDSVVKAALNLHPSLLPAYRGADPIGSQLECGEHRLGVSLHLLSQHLDRGDIVASSLISAASSEFDRESLERKTARRGCELFIDAINRYDAGWRLQSQSDVDAQDTLCDDQAGPATGKCRNAAAAD